MCAGEELKIDYLRIETGGRVGKPATVVGARQHGTKRVKIESLPFVHRNRVALVGTQPFSELHPSPPISAAQRLISTHVRNLVRKVRSRFNPP